MGRERHNDNKGRPKVLGQPGQSKRKERGSKEQNCKIAKCIMQNAKQRKTTQNEASGIEERHGPKQREVREY